MATNALAFRDKGVPLEYASVQFVREKVDTLQLEIRTRQGNLDFVRLAGKNIHFQAMTAPSSSSGNSCFTALK
ncbi:MAG: hypothetical protein ACI38O_04440 [Fibrobacter intestinalis]|uniref:hypothetical protein n=1 Tax=Fibrobacter TaxID=832 RepID=UPI00099B12F0|nr:MULTISPECIES: hypothetical protein [Fibrobacter]